MISRYRKIQLEYPNFNIWIDEKEILAMTPLILTPQMNYFHKLENRFKDFLNTPWQITVENQTILSEELFKMLIEVNYAKCFEKAKSSDFSLINISDLELKELSSKFIDLLIVCADHFKTSKVECDNFQSICLNSFYKISES